MHGPTAVEDQPFGEHRLQHVVAPPVARLHSRSTDGPNPPLCPIARSWRAVRPQLPCASRRSRTDLERRQRALSAPASCRAAAQLAGRQSQLQSTRLPRNSIHRLIVFEGLVEKVAEGGRRWHRRPIVQHKLRDARSSACRAAVQCRRAPSRPPRGDVEWKTARGSVSELDAAALLLLQSPGHELRPPTESVAWPPSPPAPHTEGGLTRCEHTTSWDPLLSPRAGKTASSPSLLVAVASLARPSLSLATSLPSASQVNRDATLGRT